MEKEMKSDTAVQETEIKNATKKHCCQPRVTTWATDVREKEATDYTENRAETEECTGAQEAASKFPQVQVQVKRAALFCSVVPWQRSKKA